MTDVQPTMNLLRTIVDRHIELEEEAEQAIYELRCRWSLYLSPLPRSGDDAESEK